ncbi:MAG: DUF1588 domain-containing protein [Myxococcaceae bacterium]|nr:DUF1588 domain-containing protein [Myxococcaceae bacterium]
MRSRFDWLAVVLLAGCEGAILGAPAASPVAPVPVAQLPVGTPERPPDGAPAPPTPPLTPGEGNPFTCEADEAPPTLDARRLTRAEYLNALRALVTHGLGAADAATLLRQVDADGRLPPEVTGGYSTADTNFSVLHARETFAIADGVATAIGAPAAYGRFVSAFLALGPATCPAPSPTALSDACEDAFIRNLTLRAWGRPIEAGAAAGNDELAAFRREFALAPTSREGVEAVVVKTLLAPAFLFHLETDLRPVSGPTHALSSHAIARRLAYTFTQAPPDEALLALAASADLQRDADFQRALALVQPRMGAVVTQFSREWLHLDGLPGFIEQNHPRSLRVRAGVTLDDGLRAAMRDEVLELWRWVNDSGGTLSDVFTSDVSFARHPGLMHVYGQQTPAPATVTTQTAVRFPAGQRSGLLTRAAMLSSGTHTENPILRAIHLRRDVLCLPTPQPGNLPPNSLAAPLPDATMTTRERYHAKTSVQPCQGCHQLINPLGFALSRYDALGRYQTTELAFDATWNVVGQLPVSSTADLSGPLGLGHTVADGLELSAVVAQTAALRSCITRNLSAYLNGLQALPPASGASCERRHMYQSLADGAPLRRLFESAVLDSRFRHRTLRSSP